MKTRVLLFSIFTIVVFAIGTTIAVLFNTVPSNSEVIALFYLSLMLTIFGLIFFVTYLFAYLRAQALPGWNQTLSSLRLGAVTGLMIVVLLAIRSVNLLNIPTFIIVLILSIAAELILRRKLKATTR